jgi:thiol-disulfide isomerase/thioredoxin
MFKLLNSARVLQGDVLNKIHNLNEEINKSRDKKKFKLLYQSSLLNSDLDQIKNTITSFEQQIHNTAKSTKLDKDMSFYENSDEIFTEYKPIKMKYNNEGDLTIEELENFDNSYFQLNTGDTTENITDYKVSTSEPEQKTEEILKKNKFFFGGNIPCMVMFYAPWCGWSKKALPEWEKLENFAKGNNKFIVKKFNDRQHGDMMEKFGIHGFPTIKLIKPEETIDYTGARKFENFKDFLKEHKIIDN